MYKQNFRSLCPSVLLPSKRSYVIVTDISLFTIISFQRCQLDQKNVSHSDCNCKWLRTNASACAFRETFLFLFLYLARYRTLLKFVIFCPHHIYLISIRWEQTWRIYQFPEINMVGVFTLATTWIQLRFEGGEKEKTIDVETTPQHWSVFSTLIKNT